jgi:molybdenum cofactor cytidylyltransferase
MTPPRVATVILAAGTSSRLGRPKQLLELGGEPLIRHTVRNALSSRAAKVVLVLGNQFEEVSDAAGPGDYDIVVNPDFAVGQSTSMVAGIASLGDDIDAALIMLGDQPTVGPDVLDRLIDAFASSGASIIQPRYQANSPGNPVLFGRELFPELLAVCGDQGARSIIKQRHLDVVHVDIDTPVPPDVDSDQDYERVQALWGTS